MSIFTQERIEEISEAMKTKESFHDFRNKNYLSMQITDSYDTGIVVVSCLNSSSWWTKWMH